MNETSSQMDKEPPGKEGQNQADRVPQETDALPFDMLQKPDSGQIERIIASRVSEHIKYPEEFKLEHIERILNQHKKTGT